MTEQQQAQAAADKITALMERLTEDHVIPAASLYVAPYGDDGAFVFVNFVKPFHAC